MKIKFKVQPYQTNAVESVVDCFAGQMFNNNISYQIDQGKRQQQALSDEGFKNTDLQLTKEQLLENIREVQRRQNIPLSDGLNAYMDAEKNKSMPASYIAGSQLNLDVEMETGTGKTYCYIKTIFEMNKRYGWSKFIIMVPSIAIREGVYKSLQMTAEHFTESYKKKARFFIYNSKRLHELESFSSDAGINIMVINIQAFNASGADNRRIYDELDDFQSRRPIDVINSNRPILIMDEPQKMQGTATQNALPKFNPLFILRYSATHKVVHNRIHRLDALDAYNQKLVKKIAVRGIQMRGLAGTNAYLYLESIEISKQAPKARLEMEIKLASGEIKRQVKPLTVDSNLYDLSGGLDQYRGFTISQIDYNKDEVEFTNGVTLTAGEATGDVNEEHIRRIQIRETIKAHFEKEQQLFSQGIKVLSLFFIDEVAKYRDYDQPDDKGDYARVFEEEYELLKDEVLSDMLVDEAYRKHLGGIEATKTHNGYFSIDKRTNRLVNPNAGTGDLGSTDVDAYDLIMKEKEKLLSFEEPTRFIFSHSALREGWDNPNVFVMCMLKHSDNTMSRRQEVGRGLRISVDKHGDRMDHPATVHEINELTVVASESYKDFVTNLQREISDAVAARPKKADMAFFHNKFIDTDAGKIKIDERTARQIYKYLVKNDYVDDDDQISAVYIDAKNSGELAELPEEIASYADEIIQLIDSVYSDALLPKIDDGRKPKTNPLNDNFDKKEFQELWSRINRKAVYRVEFDSSELVQKCISTLDSELRVTPLQYLIHTGEQKDEISDEQLSTGESFEVTNTEIQKGESVHSQVKYDLLGNLSELVHLKRQTLAEILTGVEKSVFGQFKQNPEHFISEAARLINEQKASMVIEQLQYDETDDSYDVDIFMASQTKQDFSKAGEKLKHHVYDYAITDSKQERTFVTELDTSDEVVVYAKLPNGFLIPTPVGDYNPDWAISFKEGSVKHIYFVAETKGSMSSMQLREVEKSKIKCAKKYFDEINKRIAHDNVKYDIVTDYGKLMDVVGGKVMKFLKGSRDEFAKLKDESSWEDKADIIQRQMAEVLGAKNLSFLMGSGCSSLKNGDDELGISTMKFLAEEFQTMLATEPDDDGGEVFVSPAQKAELQEKLGIDLSADDVRGNLERMMEVLITAHQFCKTSEKDELSSVATLVDDIVAGIKKFVLFKCTVGPFSNGDESVVARYRRFYQSLATRSRGLAPPWVFTTNYDLFNERAMDRSGIPYSNGFSGTVERRFNPATYRLALAEQLDITSRRWAAVDGFVHFCKLHGSVNWTEEEQGLYPIRESNTLLEPSADRVMIYPTPSKQTASFGSPYSDMFREFQRQVVQDQSVLVIMGFSFGDEHVNNIIFQGLTLPSFRLIAFIDPETNDITRELAALGDPRIWFVWGEGQEADKKAHYFDGIVNHLMPTSKDQKIDQTIEKALQTLLSKQQDSEDGEG